jgi:hypothetical protein
MFFFNKSLLPSLIFGVVLILLVRPLVSSRVDPHSLGGRFCIWCGRIIGIVAIAVFVFMSINNPDRGMMSNDKNLVELLEQGRTVEGKVLERWYDKWRPPAWMILYSFEVPNPKDNKLTTYYGSARGPKHYYASISKGDTITIIYEPNEPKINVEIYEFLNHPNYLWAFKKVGKLELFDKFRDKYKDKFENYPLLQWYEESRRK